MEFKFKVQDYQTRAADAVARVFEGQPRVEGQQYVRDLGATSYAKVRGAEQTFMGVGYDDGTNGVDATDGYRNAPLVLGPMPCSTISARSRPRTASRAPRP